MLTPSEDMAANAEGRGAKAVLGSDKSALKGREASFDPIPSTVPDGRKVDPFVHLLKRDGRFVATGALTPTGSDSDRPAAMCRESVAGSLTGSIREAQEVLGLCGEHGIAPDVEVIAEA